jgi:hypothetical protein
MAAIAWLAIVLGVALAIGYRPTAGPAVWVAAAGVLLLFALVCLSAAFGLAAKSVETASNTPMFLTLLPLLSSGFVPTGHDAGRATAVRRVPALHPREPDRARAAHRHPHRIVWIRLPTT